MRPIPASPPHLRWARALLAALVLSGLPATGAARAAAPVQGSPDPAVLSRCLERLARAASIEIVIPGSKRMDMTGFRQIPRLFAMTTEPTPTWRDSLVVLIGSPGALRAGVDSLAFRDDRQVWEVRDFAPPESTELVIDLSGTISIRSSGLRPIHTGCAPIAGRLRALFLSLPKSAWGERALATWGRPAAHVPQVSAMDSESRGLLSRSDPPDTIWYRADIGTDGRIENVFSRTFGLVDDAEEQRARAWIFRPALLDGHPIRSRLDLGLPVARGRRPAGVDSTVWTLATARTGGPPVLVEADSVTLGRLRIGGAPFDSVRLRVLVGIEGWVKDVQVVQSVPGSDRLAIDAARKNHYRPSIYHGGRISVWVEYAVPVSRSRRQIWSPPPPTGPKSPSATSP